MALHLISVTRRKNPHAVALGKLGGKARAAKLSAKEREEIARRGGEVGGRRRADNLSAEERSRISRTGGLVGGKARAAKLSKERRSEIARMAAKARWGKQPD